MNHVRNRHIYKLRKNGHTFTEIGKVYGISKTTARKIYLTQMRIYNKSECDLLVKMRKEGYNRLANTLKCHYTSNDITLDQIVSDVENLKLHWQRVPSMGEISYKQLKDFINKEKKMTDYYKDNEIQQSKKTLSKYQREVKGVVIDVYDILVAFDVTCPAMQHAVKKCIMPGQRGYKDSAQDKREAIQSIERSIELGEYYEVENNQLKSTVGNKDYWVDRMEIE